MITDTPLTFARPEWLWLCLLVIPLILLRAWSRHRTARAIRAYLAEDLRKGRVRSAGVGVGGGGVGWFRYGLLLAVLCLLAVAVAGPRKGEREEKVTSEGRSLVIALDLSKSMLAPDVHPNRLDRAKLAAQDLIAELPGDQIGVVAFAGLPFLQAPLTTDHHAVHETIQQLDTRTIPRGGTNLAAALVEAGKTFENAGVASSAVVIFSDGGELEGAAIEEAKRLGDLGSPIIAVGVGTELGELIPDVDRRGGKGYVEDESGTPVHSRLEKGILEEIATASGGLYLELNAGTIQVDLVKQLIQKIDAEHLGDERQVHPVERFRWPLAAALALLLLSRMLGLFRRRLTPTTALVASLLVFSSTDEAVAAEAAPAQAVASVEPWEALEAGRYEEAETGYATMGSRLWNWFQRDRISMGEASAAYGRGDFEKAAALYGAQLSREGVRNDAQFNLANALYQMGAALEETDADRQAHWKTALEHFDGLLAREPEHRQAQENREFVARKLKELEPEPEEEDEKEEESEEEKEDGEQKGEEESEEKEGDEEGDSEKPEDGEQEEKGDEGDSEQPEDGKTSEGGEGENEDQEGQSDQEPSEEQGDQGEPDGEEGEGGDEDEKMEAEQDGTKGEEEGEQPDESKEQGELSTDQAETGEGAPPEEGAKGENAALSQVAEQPHPETKFTPSRARALLREHADEVQTAPYREFVPFRADRYKDW